MCSYMRTTYASWILYHPAIGTTACHALRWSSDAQVAKRRLTRMGRCVPLGSTAQHSKPVVNVYRSYINNLASQHSHNLVAINRTHIRNATHWCHEPLDRPEAGQAYLEGPKLKGRFVAHDHHSELLGQATLLQGLCNRHTHTSPADAGLQDTRHTPQTAAQDTNYNKSYHSTWFNDLVSAKPQQGSVAVLGQVASYNPPQPH